MDRTVTRHCTIAVSHLDQVTWKRMDQDHFIAIGDVKWVQDEALFVDHRTNQLADLTSSDLIFDPDPQSGKGNGPSFRRTRSSEPECSCKRGEVKDAVHRG
ncbi:hypothetical protein C0Q70_19969 [Pomacea canaliculata]|uniref:Uncharacterized protein n=1 Tax=Pomacea canaliculata TaxID=400727 RepID=A0A2T7NE76_POMCA|nr:hypothetical protein C0Q70_19969 [Pomacea canaliculata]